MSTSARPRGRRPAGEDTKGAIVTAAREQFGAHGYAGVSMRAIARAAAVDPALVHHYFESKTALFMAAMESPVNPAERVSTALQGPLEDLGARIVRVAVAAWDPPEARDRLRLLLRSAMEHPAGLRAFREFLSTAVLSQIEQRLRQEAGVALDEARRRTGLVGSQLAGLIMARYVIELPAIADADVDELVGQVGPALQRYLTGPL